jgi:uncharacterized protein (TIGR02147 family)
MERVEQSIDVFRYLDYRSFCKDFYSIKKEADRSFSFRQFARDAKVAGSYLKHIIDGTRNLSPETSRKFAQGMRMSVDEADYFETLVRFNQAVTIHDKSHYLDQLRRKKSKALKPVGLAEAVSLLSHWYVLALKELVVNLNTVDPVVLQKALRRKLSDTVIQKAISDLQAFGWIEWDGHQWKSKAPQVQFPDEVRSFVIREFHRQMLGVASDALEDALAQREFGAAVFTFPQNRFSELKAKIKDFQQELVSYVQDVHRESDSAQLKVYHLGVQCFLLQKGDEK